jgi:hypothetical protein
MSVDYEQIESSQRQHDQTIEHYEKMNNLYEERILGCISLLKPKFSKDGDMFCFLFGENLQEGIAGFGKTPYEAATEFVNNFTNEKEG